MATIAENKNFTEKMFSKYPLDTAIEHINDNLNPEEVFSKAGLEEWANENGYVKED